MTFSLISSYIRIYGQMISSIKSIIKDVRRRIDGYFFYVRGYYIMVIFEYSYLILDFQPFTEENTILCIQLH